jgi:drug/metabolite transporter (DMT)-like permease
VTTAEHNAESTHAARGRLEPSALIALFAGGSIIGSSGIFVRLSETGTAATAFWRGALALPLFALWIFVAGRYARRTQRPTGFSAMRAALKDPRMFLAGALFAADIALWQWALMLISVAAATLETSLAPLLITLFAWLSWSQRPSQRFLLSLALALIGLVLIVAPNLLHGEAPLLGDILGLSAAGFYAGYIIVIARLRAAYDTAVVMFLTTLAFALVLLPLALTQKFLPDTPNGWMLLVGLAVCAQVIGQGLMAYALAHLPATLGSVGVYMQPVAAAIYAWILLGETLQPVQIVGGVVTIFAIGLATAARSHGRDPTIAAAQRAAS